MFARCIDDRRIFYTLLVAISPRGQIEVNGGAFNVLAPFGGYKQSGVGREAGKFGLEEFLETKAIQL